MEKKYIKLVSNDGYEFVMDKTCAVQSGYIKRELEKQTCDGTITFKEIPSNILEIVVRYLYHEASQDRDKEDFEVSPENAFDLLMVCKKQSNRQHPNKTHYCHFYFVLTLKRHC